MQIGALARQLGTTPDAIRFYERRGLLPRAGRGENGYREHSQADVERLRLLLGLRQLDLPLDRAAEVSRLCAAARCDEVPAEMKATISEKRAERRRIDELAHLDARLAHLGRWPRGGQPPRPLITLERRTEGDHPM